MNHNFLQGKPLDASDITDLESALKEIRNLRGFASKALQNQDQGAMAMRGASMLKNGKKEARAAVMAKGVDIAKDYVKKTVSKSPEMKKLILNAITPNILFKGCSGEEFGDIVDAFEPVEATNGQFVINQGEQVSNLI